jgi:hypothetical protein
VEIRLALEWTAQVVNLLGAALDHLNHAENEIVRGIKRVKDEGDAAFRQRIYQSFGIPVKKRVPTLFPVAAMV